MDKYSYTFIAFFVGMFVSSWWAAWSVSKNRSDESSVETQNVIRFVRDDISGLLTAMCVTNGLLAAILTALLLR